MGNEVSSYVVKMVLEAGAMFGVNPKTQAKFLPYPEFPRNRWESMDWEPFTHLVRQITSQIGTDHELVQAGRRYLYERKGSNWHLFSNFASTEKRMWVAKNYAATRLIKGYEVDYEKIAPEVFRIKAWIPAWYIGCKEFFYFSTGMWIGTTPKIESRNELLDITVTSHSVEAVVHFKVPRLKLLFSELSAKKIRLREWQEVVASAEIQEQKLQRSLNDMTAVFNATSDCVFVLNNQGLARANTAATQLLETIGPDQEQEAFLVRLQEFSNSQPPDTATPRHIEYGGRILKLCQYIDLDTLGENMRMISLTDLTEFRRLEAQLLLAEEAQQQRVAIDVQEGIGHLLGKLVHCTEELEPKLNEELSELAKEVRTLAEHCRTLGLRLSSGAIAGIQSPAAFHTALGVLAQHYQKIHRFNCTLRRPSDIDYPGQVSWTGLFRIIQEAVRNAYRHSGGDEVSIVIAREWIRIEDNGMGFPPNAPTCKGLGLRSMRIRAEQMGLPFSIYSPAASGTRVEIKLPQPAVQPGSS